MFEKLFTYPQVLARHRTSPLAEEREQYLQYRADQGTPDSTLQYLASELRAIAIYLPLDQAGAIGPPVIAAAAGRWAEHQRQGGRAQTLDWPQSRFQQTATQWLRFLGRFQEPVTPPPPYVERLADFTQALRQEQNLAPATVDNYRWHAEQFLDWLVTQRKDWPQVRLTEVDAYLAQLGTQGWRRISVATAAKALRAFFRHAQQRGWCSAPIASGIESPRIFQQEQVPGGPSWDAVQRILTHLQTDHPRDIRNYALVLLIASYGLRSGEVRRLRLDDVDWPQACFQIQHSKSGRPQTYPLLPRVGQALIRYLREVRPASSSRREVFLTLHAPFRPLSTGALHALFQQLFQRLKIATPKQGPHAVRHAWATHLLARGVALPQIGRLLGHRQTATTQIYAKVDVTALREVADFDLKELL